MKSLVSMTMQLANSAFNYCLFSHIIHNLYSTWLLFLNSVFFTKYIVLVVIWDKYVCHFWLLTKLICNISCSARISIFSIEILLLTFIKSKKENFNGQFPLTTNFPLIYSKKNVYTHGQS